MIAFLTAPMGLATQPASDATSRHWQLSAIHRASSPGFSSEECTDPFGRSLQRMAHELQRASQLCA